MTLEPKEITCQHCGGTITIDKTRDWCEKCGRRVFYDPKDFKRHRWMTYYMYAAVIGFIGTGIFLVNRFLEAFQ